MSPSNTDHGATSCLSTHTPDDDDDIDVEVDDDDDGNGEGDNDCDDGVKVNGFKDHMATTCLTPTLAVVSVHKFE